MRTDLTNLGTTELEHNIGLEVYCYRTNGPFTVLFAANSCKFMKEISVTMEAFYWSSRKA